MGKKTIKSAGSFSIHCCSTSNNIQHHHLVKPPLHLNLNRKQMTNIITISIIHANIEPTLKYNHTFKFWIISGSCCLQKLKLLKIYQQIKQFQWNFLRKALCLMEENLIKYVSGRESSSANIRIATANKMWKLVLLPAYGHASK